MSRPTYGTSPAAASTRPRPLTGPLDERRARLLPILMGLLGLVAVAMFAAPAPGVGVWPRVLLALLFAPLLIGAPIGAVAIPLHRYGHSRQVLHDQMRPHSRLAMGILVVGSIAVYLAMTAVAVGLAGIASLVLGAVGMCLVGIGLVRFLLGRGML